MAGGEDEGEAPSKGNTFSDKPFASKILTMTCFY